MTRVRQGTAVIVLVLMHLVVVPCATAMMLLPADADCQHCVATESPEICLEATDYSGSGINGLAFDSGRADPPLPFATLSLLPATQRSTRNPQAAAFQAWSHAFATRQSGDPPLYLRLGRLLN